METGELKDCSYKPPKKTREEETKQMAKSYTQVVYGSLDDFSDITDAFVDGAKWADETMLENVCEFIKNNKHLYKVLSFGSLSIDWDKFIRELCKAMKK